MRVDPSYINNLVAALDQTQANQQQYSSELSGGVRVTSLGTDPVAAGRECAALERDSAGRLVYPRRPPM